jgi:hypothetical protein
MSHFDRQLGEMQEKLEEAESESKRLEQLAEKYKVVN